MTIVDSISDLQGVTLKAEEEVLVYRRAIDETPVATIPAGTTVGEVVIWTGPSEYTHGRTMIQLFTRGSQQRKYVEYKAGAFDFVVKGIVAPEEVEDDRGALEAVSDLFKDTADAVNPFRNVGGETVNAGTNSGSSIVKQLTTLAIVLLIGFLLIKYTNIIEKK